MAEDLALSYLQRSGLKLVARNFRSKVGELDLIMKHGRYLVFVEVRLRTNERFGDGGASVTRAKQRRVAQAAGLFLGRHPQYAHHPCRFDVVSVTSGHHGWDCRWIADAFC